MITRERLEEIKKELDRHEKTPVSITGGGVFIRSGIPLNNYIILGALEEMRVMLNEAHAELLQDLEGDR